MKDRIEELKSKGSYASILMTYSCTIACEHCCFTCSPEKLPVVVSVDDAVAWLAEFHKLDRAVHIAGGEPFKFYGRLLEIVRAAADHGVPPHFIETNCSWCTSDELVRERMTELKSLGVLWMFISTDHSHLLHGPVDRVLRGIAIAEEVFGPGTTMGKSSVEEVESRFEIATNKEKRTRFRREHPPVLVGRAQQRLAHHAEPQPLEQLDLETGWGLDPGNTCKRDWDPLWEIHVDPYSNVQTNCGVILGNAKEIPIAELMRTWPESHPVLHSLSQRGPAFLVETALEHGFVLEDRYPQKCFLCTEVRTYLRNCDDGFKRLFGPDEVYQE